ncbi:hypothetical protein TrRE_jg8061 [Triparma retinervis]|uniref:Methyltransferase domain-containing protein n=1 Tax=Triparma retinervis TaxID=2557542 RepID=A0A9W7ANY5_9STRA|nr:hypothetical protein TrRE_jg8061 [Triparma retinervis]
MLAPRKKLWSTPERAVTAAIDFVAPFKEEDVVYDVGCGDGRVLIKFAMLEGTSTRTKFVGVEIDEDRANEARENVEREGLSQRIVILCENALMVDYSDATVVFLYLIPRGLRLIKPILLGEEGKRGGGRRIKIVTYMSEFEGETFVRKVNVEPEHQKGAGWPVHLYELEAQEASLTG